MAVIRHGDSIALTFWECGHIEVDQGKEHPCPLDVCQGEPERYVPASQLRGAVLRPDYEQVVTDILVALDDFTDLPDGPSVDDARAAVMRELTTYFGGQ